MYNCFKMNLKNNIAHMHSVSEHTSVHSVSQCRFLWEQREHLKDVELCIAN